MKRIILASAFLTTASYTLADHSVELELGYATVSESVSAEGVKNELDSRDIIFSGRWFINGTSTAQGPIAEAGFLSQSSAIEFGNIHSQTENTYQYSGDLATFEDRQFKYHSRTSAVRGYAVIDRMIMGGAYSEGYSEGEKFYSALGIEGGYYIQEAATITVGVVRFKFEDEPSESDTRLLLEYKQVFKPEEQMSYSVEAGVIRDPDSNAFTLAGTVYFTPAIGLTLDILRFQDDFDNLTEWGITYQHFLTHNIAASAGYRKGGSSGFIDDNASELIFGVQANF